MDVPNDVAEFSAVHDIVEAFETVTFEKRA